MATFIYLTSGAISEVVERDYSDPEQAKHFHHVCPFPAALTTISSSFFVLFSANEVGALLDDSPASYFADFWNWVDMATLSANLGFLVIITIC